MSLTIESTLSFERKGRGARKVLREGPEPAPQQHVPRVSQLMALALHYQYLLEHGVADDYADLARLGQVSRARVSQIMNLMLLAPDIQEALLELPPVTRVRGETLILADLQPITVELDWGVQREMWRELVNRTSSALQNTPWKRSAEGGFRKVRVTHELRSRNTAQFMSQRN